MATTSIEEVSEIVEYTQAHAGFLNESHACARGAVEHPRWDLDAIGTLAFVELADQHTAVRLRGASHHQLLVEARVPAIAHAADLGIVGIASGTCTTGLERTRPWPGTARNHGPFSPRGRAGSSKYPRSSVCTTGTNAARRDPERRPVRAAEYLKGRNWEAPPLGRFCAVPTRSTRAVLVGYEGRCVVRMGLREGRPAGGSGEQTRSSVKDKCALAQN